MVKYIAYFVVYTVTRCILLSSQSNEVRFANNMEKEGLIRSLDFIEGYGVKIDTFITDRHLQVNKYLREKRGWIKHYYDVWHVAKGI